MFRGWDRRLQGRPTNRGRRWEFPLAICQQTSTVNVTHEGVGETVWQVRGKCGLSPPPAFHSFCDGVAVCGCCACVCFSAHGSSEDLSWGARGKVHMHVRGNRAREGLSSRTTRINEHKHARTTGPCLVLRKSSTKPPSGDCDFTCDFKTLEVFRVCK